MVAHECGFLPRLREWHHDGVCSPFWRLYLDGAPAAWLRCDGRAVSLGPRVVVVVPDHVVFDCRARRARPHLWVHFSLPVYVRSSDRRIFSLPVDAALHAVGGALRQALATPERDAVPVGHLAAALIHLVAARLPATLRPPLPPRLAATLAYLHQVPAERVDNRALARRAGLGLRTFLTRFREEVGDSPAHYLQTLRLREAARRLVMGDDSIEQVAGACGFANRHYLSRQFAAHYGRGPAAFRREARRAPK